MGTDCVLITQGHDVALYGIIWHYMAYKARSSTLCGFLPPMHARKFPKHHTKTRPRQDNTGQDHAKREATRGQDNDKVGQDLLQIISKPEP